MLLPVTRWRTMSSIQLCSFGQVITFGRPPKLQLAPSTAPTNELESGHQPVLAMPGVMYSIGRRVSDLTIYHFDIDIAWEHWDAA